MAYNNKGRQTTYPSTQVETDYSDTIDFSIPTTRGTYFASKHRSPHFGLGIGVGSGGQRLLYSWYLLLLSLLLKTHARKNK